MHASVHSHNAMTCFSLMQKFEVTDWPEQDYGKFYSGDSYIVLNVSMSGFDDLDLNHDKHCRFTENKSHGFGPMHI